MLRTLTVGITQLLTLLSRLANNHHAAIRSGHRATNHQNVVFGIHARHGQALGGDANVAHVTRRAVSLDNSRGISRSTDRTRRAHVHRTVRLRTTIEMVTLDRARETTSLRTSDHVHHLAVGKLIDEHFVADVRAVAAINETKLFQNPRRWHAAASLLAVTAHRLRH